MTDLTPTDTPGKILSEIRDYSIHISIHTDSGISGLDLDPAGVYAIAQYIEWLTEAPSEEGDRDAPSVQCPPGVGVWGETRPGSTRASIVHIALVGDDDEDGFGQAIALSPPVATVFANSLIAKAALVA